MAKNPFETGRANRPDEPSSVAPSQNRLGRDASPYPTRDFQTGSDTTITVSRRHRHLQPALLGLALLTAGVLPVAAAPGVAEVIIVFKTHFDIGYTDMASNVVQRYRSTMIDDALKVVDQNRGLPPEQQFVWTLPGWPMAKIAEDWPGQTPERKQRILQALKDGRFVVHALPFTTHTELLEPEDLVRGLGFASRLARSVGLELPRDAKMTDVPCHSWILPTLLKNAGVDFLHLGCNAASRSPEVPRLFWWEGADGSRVLTMYSAESYGTGLAPPAGWPYKTWLALIHTGDNHGPPTPEEVRKLLEEAKQKLPGVKVRIGRLSDFSDGILAERAEIPVVRGDMPDTWIHGPMSDPTGAGLARQVRPQIAKLEILNTLMRVWGCSDADLSETVAQAYEKSLLYGEHTWGGALYWVSQYAGGRALEYGGVWWQQHDKGKFARLEASWAEHTAYIEQAQQLTGRRSEQQPKLLAAGVGVEGTRIVVFNPLPWKRDGMVVTKSAGKPSALRAVDDGEIVPAQSYRGPEGESLRFVARNVPALGYRTYVPANADIPPSTLRTDQATGTLENAFLRVVLDPERVCIRSIVDKRSGRELVDTNATFGFGQVLWERFDADQVAAFVKAYVKIDAAWATNELGKPSMPPASEVPYRAVLPNGGFLLSMEQTPVHVEAIIMEGAPTQRLQPAVVVRLERDQPCLELTVFAGGRSANPWPEAGWLCLPFAVDEPQFRLGRLGGIVDPAKDIVTGANRHLLALNSGMTVTDQHGLGVGLCASLPLVSLEQPGCWKYSRDFVPRKAHVFVNLYNNQWTTNFRLWNGDPWVSSIRIWSVEGGDPATNLVKPSWEARVPLQVESASGPAGKLSATQSGLEVSRPGVLVTAFGQNPDGPGLVLRLWEQAGQSGTCRVTLPQGLVLMALKSVQPVDLRGRVCGPEIPVKDGAFEFQLPAFAPASFVLSPAPATSRQQ